MTWARVISEPIQSEDLGDDRYRMLRALVVDLGLNFVAGYSGFRHSEVKVGRPLSTIATVPKGFETDFSSIPLWSQPILLGPKSRYRVAGAVHDLAYLVGVPRRLADRIWRHVARSGEGVGPVRGFLGWLGLRLGGWVAWRRHKRAREG